MGLQKDILQEVESILLRDLVRDVGKQNTPLNVT